MTSANQDKASLAAAVLLERLIRDTYTARHSSEIQPLQWSILRYLAAHRAVSEPHALARGACHHNIGPAWACHPAREQY